MQVSIITPTLNSEDYLHACLESIANQEGVEIEHIVIDGGSSDETLSILSNSNAKVHHQKSEGLWKAFEEGFSLANGEILGVLNSDDYFYNREVIKKVKRYFSEDESLDFVYGNSLRVDADGSPLYLHRPSPQLTLDDVNKKVFVISHHALFFQKRVLKKNSFVNPDERWSHDLIFIRNLFKGDFKGLYIPETIACFRIHGENASLHYHRSYPKKLFKKWNNLPPFFFSWYRLKEVFKHKKYLSYLIKRKVKSWFDY